MKDQKGTKKSSPYHTADSPRLPGSLSPALLWGHAATGHPWPIAAGAASCRATPITAPTFGLLGGAFASPAQSSGHNKSKSKSKKFNQHQLLWERACPRCQHFVPPDRTRCLHRGPARLPQGNMSVADPAFKQAGRSAASTAVDLPAPSGGRVEVLRSGTGAREPERSEGRTPGASLFGYFFGVWKK